MSEPSGDRATAAGARVHGDDHDDKMAYEEEEGEDEDFDMPPSESNAANDEAPAAATTNAPDPETPLQLHSPPGSSPGMIMRSGRRKRRGVSTGGVGAPTPTPRKAAKRSKIRHGEGVAEREDVGTGGGVKGKLEEEKEEDGKERGDDGNAAVDDVGAISAERREVSNDPTSTVPSAASAESTAASSPSSVANSAVAAAAAASVTVNAAAAPSHHTVQGIRLPSQRTPQPPKTPAVPNAESRAEWQLAGGGGPGGRRLVFDPSPVAEAPRSSSSAGSHGGVTVAQRLRWQREMQQQQQQQQQSQRRTDVDVSKSVSDGNQQQQQQQDWQQQQPSPEQDSDNATFLTRTKRYVQRHFLYALSLFLLMQTAHITGMDSPLCETFPHYAAFLDREAQKDWLADSYGINWKGRYHGLGEGGEGVVEVNGEEVDVDDDDAKHDDDQTKLEQVEKEKEENEEEDEEEEEVEIIQEETIIYETDPHLLQLAETQLRAQQLKEYQLRKLDLAIAQMERDLAVLDSVSLPEFSEKYDAKVYEEKSKRVTSGIERYRHELEKWETAVEEAEVAMEGLFEGELEVEEANEVLEDLERVSLVGGSKGRVLDVDEIVVPGEGCEGMDYILPAVLEEAGEDLDMEAEQEEEEEEEEEEAVVVVGGIDVQALDLASDALVRYEDAQNAFKSLIDLAEETKDALIDEDELGYGRKWLIQVLNQELEKLGLNTNPPSYFEPLNVTIIDPSSSTRKKEYTAVNILSDIDRLLEIETADRTGKFDLASIAYGARVLRRGPRATSLSLYETLPLFNRILAYSKLRFYGHPPEAALVPSISMHPRGQCWSFQNEWTHPLSSNRRGITRDGIRGEYATLTVALVKPVFVSEVVVEHLPASLSKVDAKSAVKRFRVVGFEDVGAFGEPWELGTFEYNIHAPFSLQMFQIPSSIDGLSVPKLKAISLAVDSNWGADYTCLYRFRVHGV
ncbi:hypothetical protein ACHAXS_011956 [Conticribra weissflogii]